MNAQSPDPGTYPKVVRHFEKSTTRPPIDAGVVAGLGICPKAGGVRMIRRGAAGLPKGVFCYG
jgi:hypothetical protein